MRTLLIALLFTTACKGDEKESTKQDPASTSAATAHREADDKATEDEQARNAAKADVAAAQAATDVTAAKARAEAGEQRQKNFDAADRRFNALKERAVRASGKAKRAADASIADATAREAKVMAGIAALRDASGGAWEATKTQVDADTAALTQALDSLEIALK